MELYFTRHGKTEWNNERRFQGMMGDSPLLESSYEEIKLLGQHLKEVPFEKIYTSSALRAQKTAEGIAAQLDHTVEIISTEGLKELGLGQLEGQRIDDMYEKYPHELKNLRFHLEKYDPTIFQGEPIQHALDRIEKVVTQAVATAEKGPLLFVGHGASLTAAIQWLAGKELAQLREMGGLVNNSVTLMTTSDRKALPYRLEVWNDSSFLGDASGRDALL